MTLEQQESKRRAEVMLAFANGAPIERKQKDRPDLEWGIVTTPVWDLVLYDYRVSPNPVVNWDTMPAWANWLAKDADGDWAWYSHKPELSDDMWASDGFEGSVPSEYYPKYAGTKPWHELIIERPKK